ncbi:hypothetical protein B0T26DRAFT_744882 [Lasiosphaeria miniovina]|uniref:DUF8212 domain-containing protein n=1 Tax=Lasiosphaeria miniovina TaxID=1954250 RepID=A0AA40DJ84_9PEZI|nr:uncharacterized protein B0T26DRAFT_744882 [Lasiosphaeria miniovina]KAK0701928.1 hypothetical protein B0T26DRAFT_744882 [Lasiosphaeria miniovina]
MRLLNASTLRLTEFIGDSVSPYAALSHTWRGGYLKIAWCCDQAKQDNLEWAWVETCCIDKTSSSKLSEAINSMSRWYQNCRVCYTFSDVSDGDVPQAQDSEFRRSRWFTRGWTLQELLALERMLCQAISEVSRIPSDYFCSGHRSPIFAASIAQRMLWAASRCTTRREDVAYCLLGIFDVNMPLLYGEGKKAFQRLQEEIIKHTNDSSIFAWGFGMSESCVQDSTETQYLASSPSDFMGCHSIVIDEQGSGQRVDDFEVTKKGLRISISSFSEII